MRIGLVTLALVLLPFSAAAQTLISDPHLDLPKSAAASGRSGASDVSSQFDLDRARAGRLDAAAIALFVP